MRRVQKPEGAEEKTWGWMLPIYEDGARRMVRCFAVDGGFCSIHIHRHQNNVFIVEDGALRIFVEDQAFYIRTGEVFCVQALDKHHFESLGDTEFLEVYLGRGNYRPLATDIVRYSDGGVKIL